MMRKKLQTLAALGIFSCSVSVLAAAEFAPPAEGPVAFRRDKIPLDTDTMAGLSKQLETLAAGLAQDSPANRRTTAQMLALATALDPSNTSARDLISSLQSGTAPTPPDPARIEKDHLKIWQYIGWLETPEAGPQGGALAACLLDVMAVSDPKHPRSEAIRKAGERGAWAGWIPALAAYEPKVMAQTETPEPEAGHAEEQLPQITLTAAEVFTPMWQKTGKDDATAKWNLAPSLLKMTARKSRVEEGPPTEFLLSIKSGPESTLQPLAGSLKSLLKKQYPKLPAGWHVIISGEELQKSILSGKRQSISAAAAVLANSAISGREPNATIIGTVDEQGAFKLSTGFWDQLSCLGKGNGGRLVLPAAAADFLPSFLALEKPQFFFDYEVVLAANFKELVDLSAKSPPEAVAAASAKFQEIRAKSASQPVGQYVANPFIRRRLAELAQEAPYHWSARLLAIQGAGNRPIQVPRSVLVPEIRRAILPMAWLVRQNEPFNNPIEASKIEQLAQTYETCRAQVEALDRYTLKEDREMLLHVKAMVAAIRPMERAARARGEDYTIRESVSSARIALLKAYESVTEELNEAMGDSEGAAAP